MTFFLDSNNDGSVRHNARTIQLTSYEASLLSSPVYGTGKVYSLLRELHDQINKGSNKLTIFDEQIELVKQLVQKEGKYKTRLEIIIKYL